MLLAVAWEDEFIQDSLALATFVAIATQGIPSVLDLHVQAKTFLSRHSQLVFLERLFNQLTFNSCGWGLDPAICSTH